MLTVCLELAVQVPCLLRCKTHAIQRMPSILRDLHREGATSYRSCWCKSFGQFHFSAILVALFSLVPSLSQDSGTYGYCGDNSFQNWHHNTIKSRDKCTLRSCQENRAPLLRFRHYFLFRQVFVQAVSAQILITHQADCFSPFPLG